MRGLPGSGSSGALALERYCAAITQITTQSTAMRRCRNRIDVIECPQKCVVSQRHSTYFTHVLKVKECSRGLQPAFNPLKQTRAKARDYSVQSPSLESGVIFLTRKEQQ